MSYLNILTRIPWEENLCLPFCRKTYSDLFERCRDEVVGIVLSRLKAELCNINDLIVLITLITKYKTMCRRLSQMHN